MEYGVGFEEVVGFAVGRVVVAETGAESAAKMRRPDNTKIISKDRAPTMLLLKKKRVDGTFILSPKTQRTRCQTARSRRQEVTMKLRESWLSACHALGIIYRSCPYQKGGGLVCQGHTMWSRSTRIHHGARAGSPSSYHRLLGGVDRDELSR